MRIATIFPTTAFIVATMALSMPLEAQAAMQCVTYARSASGLNLKGDAWKWWDAAAGVYDRGNRPREGAVLVFKRQGSMAHGHVSVIRHITSSREVLVDHANWAASRTSGRGKVVRGVPVIDVSPGNDWSQVRVYYGPIGEIGSRVYHTQGFVYRPGSPAPHHVIPAHAGSPLHHGAPARGVSTHGEATPAPAARPVQQAALRLDLTPPPPPVPQAPPAEPPEPRAAGHNTPVAAAAPPPAAPAPVATKRQPDSGRFDVSRWAEQS